MLPHIPVMLHEVISYFQKKEIKTFFDGTLGAGGHAKALLESHPEMILYIGADRDEEALLEAKKNLKPWLEKIWFIHEKFSEAFFMIKRKGILALDGILLDLGVSSMQFDRAERGFSFSKEGPLDMRMGKTELTAEEVVNTFPEKKLEEIFRLYGEERRSKLIASALVEERRKKKFHTTKELATFIEKRIKRRGRIHPATQIFQALRIFVNDELNELKKTLEEGIQFLNPTQNFGVISFHSLEDRIVKHTFKKFEKEKIGKVLTKKVLVPTRKEMIMNPRSRSAKLRLIEKL